jgi:uncharacterized protein YlxW (UPF0749 family)
VPPRHPSVPPDDHNTRLALVELQQEQMRTAIAEISVSIKEISAAIQQLAQSNREYVELRREFNSHADREEQERKELLKSLDTLRTTVARIIWVGSGVILTIQALPVIKSVLTDLIGKI